MKKAKLMGTNRIISVVLALTMLLSMVAVGGFTASANETASVQVWDGWTTTAPADTDADGIYEITNGAELAYVIKTGGSGRSYKLTADIYLNDITKVNWLTGTVSDGYTVNSWYGDWNVTAFQGTIDGAGHTINGLYYEKDAAKEYTNYCGGVGLIPKLSNATVKNLGVDNSYIHQEASVSAFVAAAPAGSVLNMDSCYVGENVYLKAGSTGAFRAFASNAGGGVIINCYSLATLDGVNYSGLLAFNYDNGRDVLTISNCYNAKGPVSNMGDTSYYGIIEGNYETVASAFSEGNTLLSNTAMQGENALANMSTLNNYGNYYVATEKYPALSIFKGIEIKEFWNGTVSVPTETDEEGNILINNAKELAYIIRNGGAAGANYKLTSDIYLNNLEKINWETGVAATGYTPNSWEDNKAFQGTINGDGHVVYGLYFTHSASYGWGFYGEGLIPRVAAGTSVSVSELGIDYAYVVSPNGASAFVGFAGTQNSTTKANVTIDQCYVGANVTLKGNDVGAFRGGTYNSVTTITNSYSLATLNANSTSGFIGNTWNAVVAVENSFNANGAILTEGYSAADIAANLKNVYATNAGNYPGEITELTADNMKGTDVFTNQGKMPTLNTTGKFVTNEEYPSLVAFLGYDIIVGEEVWDGTTSAPSDTDGDGVYEIGTAEELAFIVENGGGNNYKLTNDIYLNAIDYIDWQTGEVTRGYAAKSWYYNTTFSGSIDGDGHTVYGLYYNVPEATKWGYQGVGLIPRVNNGYSVTITNLAVDNAYVCAANGVSAFVGIVGPTSHQEDAEYANATIENCYAGKNVTLKGHHAGVFRGATYRANTTIKNCYTLATAVTLSAEGGAAGIFGNEWTSNVTVRNAFNANGGVGGQDRALAGKNFSGVYATNRLAGDGNEYVPEAFTVLTPNNMKGRDALESPQKLYELNSDNAFEATTGYPILVAFIKDVVEVPETSAVKIWEGTGVDTEPTKVDALGNILITSAEELAYIIENGGAAGATYKLTTNIYLNDVNKINWATGEPIGDYVPNTWYENISFQGNIDGDGHIVYGLYSNVADAYAWGYWGQGLVPRVDNGVTVTIKNLGMDNVFINATNAGGALVGFVGTRNSDAYTETANVNIEQCFIGENASINANNAGAFVGAGRGAVIDVKNAYSLAEINSVDYKDCAVDFAPSGFVGNDWNVDFTVNNSYNAKGTLQGWWDGTTSSNSKNNYATGYDIDKTATGGEREAYYAVMLDAANMQGLDVFTSGEKMWKLNADSVYTATKGYPELTIFIKRGNSDAFRVWDGSKMEPTNGSGTDTDPYLISYASELAYIIYNGGAANTYYKLTNDIYLNNIYMIDWATGEATDGYTPNTWFENLPFQGNIDGDGHTVYGLYYNDGADLAAFGYYYNSGLIPRVNDNTSVSVTNLGIDNAFVHSAQGASAFVGFAGATGNYAPEVKAQVTINNCYAGAKVYLEGGNTGVFRGGERGSNTVVTNSYSLANTVGNKYDGLVGNFWSSTVSLSNVYNANGAVATDEAATTGNLSVSNVYATDNTGFSTGVNILTKNEMIGENALDVMNGLSTDTFKAIPGYYPVLTKFSENTLVKNNRLYYVTSLNDAVDFCMTASGEQYFWRYNNILVNEDSSMDISDLVLMTLQYNAGTAKADIDGDGNSTTDDMKILRKALMGRTDYMENPLYSVGDYAPVTELSSDYQFVWGDEFDGDSLNTQKWGIYGKMNGSGMGYGYTGENGSYEFTDEVVDYTGDVICSGGEDAVGVADGNLRLTAYKAEDGTYVVPTSVVTQNTMNFKYGYVEIRAKFPVEDGIWSSWWTKSVFDKSDTNCLAYPETNVGAEVDMIEVFDTNQATFNIIKWWENKDGRFGSWYPNDAPHAFRQEITNDRYYVFGYEWTEDDKLKMYCDGVLYGEYDVSEAYTEKVDGRNYIVDTSGTDMECFDAHQFIIFNNHLFYPTVSSAGMFITENTDFTSADFLIDYCRVYQKPGSSDIVTK